MRVLPCFHLARGCFPSLSFQCIFLQRTRIMVDDQRIHPFLSFPGDSPSFFSMILHTYLGIVDVIVMAAAVEMTALGDVFTGVGTIIVGSQFVGTFLGNRRVIIHLAR